MLCLKNKSEENTKQINKNTTRKIKGTVVLMKKNVLDFTDVSVSFLDRIYEVFGKGVSLQLISAVHLDPGKPTFLERWVSSITPSTAGETVFDVKFYWDEDFGVPGAFIIKNYHYSQFYLRSFTLEDVPGHGRIHFVCNSWVYPVRRYKYDRVFFCNKTYLPHDTPEPLRKYREEELVNLRGDGMLKEWDRVYDIAPYNDLGSPEKGNEYARPCLGTSKDFPYPRRGRTGRKPVKTVLKIYSTLQKEWRRHATLLTSNSHLDIEITSVHKDYSFVLDHNTESRLPLISLNIYVPRDERFGHLKMSDFLAYALKSILQVLNPELRAIWDKTPNEFDAFEDVLNLYEEGFKVPKSTITKLQNHIPWELLKELFRTDGERFLKFPPPEVIKEDKTAWKTDEEFAREMLAGINPVVIRRLETFPPTSKLDSHNYGNQLSTITREQVEKNMDGYNVDQAIKMSRLFILDHHDTLMPYLRRINSTTTKTYATRTVLFLKYDGTLKPLAIELSLPHPDGDHHGAVSQVYTPAEGGVQGSIWQLAKAYVAVNDSGHHQLISHWLHTHAVMEPFVIATNRQLSVIHPIFKLLHSHFRDTMNINAFARQILINAGGVVEATVFPAKFSMEMSSFIYRNWVFTEGMVVKDSKNHHGLRLLIEDYPYAIDGLEIWSAIETWVDEYCSLYHPTDELVQHDTELQSWWKEIHDEGHGDQKDSPRWPEMKTRDDLIKTSTIIIWIGSALHAAVNFGQYHYAGYLPNRLTDSRRFMPQPGTPEYAELESDPEKAFLKTITAKLQTLLGIALIEILSRHSSDEVYVGQRETAEWTTDSEALAAFDRFRRRLLEIENNINERNGNKELKNRAGPVNVPYTLLHPSTSDISRIGGLTGRGIPNSVSI